jgi:hypothetical protein
MYFAYCMYTGLKNKDLLILFNRLMVTYSVDGYIFCFDDFYALEEYQIASIV